MSEILRSINPAMANLLLPAAPAAVRPLRQRREPAPYVDEEEERTIAGSMRDKSLSMIGAVGNLLDLPGSMVRDVGSSIVQGKFVNPFDQLLSPFSGDNRTTGKELLQQTGIIDDADTWGNAIAGFGAEVAADPLTYMTFGASALGKAGKVASKAGMMDDLGMVAARKAGKEIGQVGPREARLTTTLGDIAQYGTERSAAKAKQVLEDSPELANEVLGGLAGFGLPFMQPMAVAGQGAKSQAVARGLDTAGRAVRYGKIPGTEFQPVNSLLNLFDAPAMGAKSPMFQAIARHKSRQKDVKSADVLMDTNRWATELEQAGLVGQDAADMLRDGLEGVVPISSLPDAMQPIVRQMRAQSAEMPNRGRLEGAQITELTDDEIDYAARFLVATRGIHGKRSKAVFTADDPSNQGRKDFIRNAPGGTNKLKRELFLDDAINAAVDSGVDVDTIRKMMEAKANGWLPDTFKEFNPKAEGAVDGWVIKEGRYEKIAEWFGGLSKETREAGVFGNHPILDHTARRMAFEDSINATETVALALSQPKILLPPSAAANAAADGSMTVGEVLAKLKMDLGDVNGGLGRKIMKSKGMAPDDDSIKVLRDMRLSKENAEELLSIHKTISGPDAINDLISMMDSVVNYSKGMWTSVWPAFHVRNRISGAFQNMALGIWSKEGDTWADQLLKGKVIEGATKEPWVRAVWEREQAELARVNAATPPLPQLTDEEATRIIGRMAASQGVVGKFEGNATSIVGQPTGQSGDLMDTLSGIPRPGNQQISAGRVARKAAGREPGTSLNPFDVRGVGGREESGFGIAAAGEEIGNYIEGMNRLGPFITMMKRGYDPAEASKKVGAAQVLYGNKNYTPFEQQVMTRLFPFYKFCVPTDHEILTQNGWKLQRDLSIGELVLAFDAETEALRWEPVQNIHVFPHKGTIQVYRQKRKGRVTEFKFTEDHRWPVSSRKRSRAKEHCGVAVALKTYNRTIKRAYELTDEDRLYRTGNFQGEESVLGERHAALLGWIVTDGYMRHKVVKGRRYPEAVIYQSPKKFLKEVIELTGSKPRAPHPDTGVVCLNVKIEDLRVIVAALEQNGGLVGVATRLSRSAAESMRAAMMQAEGTIQPSGQEIFYQYAHNDVLDAFQILCMMTGRSANLCQQGCTVARKKYYTHIPSHSTTEEFDGDVWCPETPSGTWVMRHNGSVVITGNSRGSMPVIARNLMEKPGGMYGTIIKGNNRAQSDGELAPDYVRDTANIPIDRNNPILSAIAGTPPEGTDRYLTGLGLMHEDLLGFGPSVRGAGLEAMSRMNPFVKGPIEWATGQTFFQRGPEGGRDLDKLDPTVGRFVANVMGQTGPDDSKKFPLWMEQIVANSPIARLTTTARSLTDPRKRSETVPGMPGAASLLNTLTGFRVSDVSPASKDAILREMLNSEMQDAGATVFERVYFSKEELAKMSPEARENAIKLQGLANVLAKRSKERKAEREAAAANK
jgi:hypothetical protein